MNNVHLNEEQLQYYALEGLTDEHVQHCTHCQKQIRAYQMLYSHIKKAEEPLLDLSISELIPGQLPDDKRENRYLWLLLSACVLLLAIVVGLCWSMISWLFTDFTAVSIVFGLLLGIGVLILQFMELAPTRKKICNLNSLLGSN
jgi:hypothetical protein